MNPAPLLFLLLSAIAAPGLHGTAAAADSNRSIPRDSQKVEDWARVHEFKLTRAPGAREIVVGNGTTRIEMLVDSSRIEVNGVGLWLSNPVTLHDQSAYLSNLDIRGVLEALFSPHKLLPGRRLRVICLDPGHGGKEPGQRANGRLEKQYTLLLAGEVRERLLKAGFAVVLTRRDDSYPELPERTEIARRHGADLFVSLHYNAAADGGSEASGIEVYAMTPEGTRSTNISNDQGSLKAGAGNEFDEENLHLAFQIQKSILRNLPGIEDRGVRRARFVVLRLAEMPAVLIEGGFMSNPSDARWIYSETGRRRMAQAIVDGISNYRRLVERPAPQRSTSSKSSSSTAPPDSAKN